MINTLLSRSAELEKELHELFAIELRLKTDRIISSRTMCLILFEHAQSAKILVGSGNYTSAISLLRLQYEALVRAMWLFYSATDATVSKLTAELTQESAKKANNLPMLSKMLEQLTGKAPKDAVDMLNEFKEYSYSPLSSFIHSGIHPMNRSINGYPEQFLIQLLKLSNGVSLMAGMQLIILANDGRQMGRIPAIQRKFSECLPDL